MSDILTKYMNEYDLLIKSGSWAIQDIDRIIASDSMSQFAIECLYSNGMHESIGDVKARSRAKKFRIDMLRRMRELALSTLGVEAGA